jgi:3-carboxy-cis,cis-muconate cycloisomerase
MSDMYDESTLNDMYFTTKEMKRIFSDANKIQKQMDCEAVLAEVEAALGMIPPEAAAEIVKKSRVEYIDFEALRADFNRTGHPFVPLVHAYKKICEGNAGEYVHWGATTQDILDTAGALQIKEAYELLMQRFEELYKILAEQAYRYKDLVMVGRTNGQHAMPITLGYKISVWGFELRDNIDRLHEAEKRVFKGEFAGAVGTLASLGEQGLRVQAGFLKRLGLGIPAVAWSSSRNHYAELVSDLAIMAATFGKIGTEVYALQKSEIDELEEQQGEGAIGSSTMPHKRNPFRSMELSTNARIARGCAETMLGALETEHERDPRSASVENVVFEQIFSLLHASVERAISLMKNLVVHPEHMQRNIAALHGLIFSEAVMMELGKKLGRQSAHEIVHKLSMKAFETETPLAALLKADARVTAVLSAEAIDTIMQPEKYIGQAAFFAEQLKRQKDAYFADKGK